MFLTVSLYVWQFGTHLSVKQDEWAGFGEYFGGVLNPFFALLAFLGLLWSIQKQGAEFRDSLQLLQRQAISAEEQVKAMRLERMQAEMLHVMKDIDERLERILNFVVTGPGIQELTVRRMASEAQRLKRHPDAASLEKYEEFVRIAQWPDSVIGTRVQELVSLVRKSREFLEAYDELQSGPFSPMLRYYADKCRDLMYLVEDVGNLPADSREFFSHIANA